MKKFIYTVLLALSVASFVGCNDDDVASAQMTLNFEVVLPTSMGKDTLTMEAARTRVAGDPGLAEFFERPRFMYLFLAPGKPTTPTSNPIYFYNIPTSQNEWTRSSDSLVFQGSFSQIVNWDKNLKLEDLKDGNLRAYIVASFDAITTDPNGITTDEYNKVTYPITTESQLLNLKFFAEGNGGYQTMSLRDIYSTPYNLGIGWTLLGNAMSDRTNYYGTVTNIVGEGSTGIIALKDTIYHLASKVDFQWDAVQHNQSNVMQSAVVNNCPRKGYLFRPTDTTGDGFYSKILLDNATSSPSAADPNRNNSARYSDADVVDPGNQWSGRAYTYLLQPGTISYNVTTSMGGAHTGEKVPVSNGFTNDIFAAWYKLNFSIKASN